MLIDQYWQPMTRKDRNAKTGRISARKTIVKAAESVFGREGFNGASMRAIASEAKVTQASLYYHFADKDALYEEVFRLYSTEIQDRRARKLNEIETREKFELEDILTVFFTSAITTDASSTNANTYVELVGSIGISADPRSKALMEQFYDPTAVRFVKLILKSVPGLSSEKAVWSYLFCIGARLQAHARNDRANRLARSLEFDLKESPYDLLVVGTAASIRALAR